MLPTMEIVDEDHDYRIMAVLAPENPVYTGKLVLIAMPNLTDACPKVVGTLVVSTPPEFESIEWIEVDADNRRKGLGRRLWKAAEKVLGRELMHDPVTLDGEAFAAAMEQPDYAKDE